MRSASCSRQLVEQSGESVKQFLVAALLDVLFMLGLVRLLSDSAVFVKGPGLLVHYVDDLFVTEMCQALGFFGAMLYCKYIFGLLRFKRAYTLESDTHDTFQVLNMVGVISM